MTKKIALAHLSLLGANLIFGVNYVIAKGIMPDFLQPRAIIFLRVIGATIIFWIIGLFMKKERIPKKDMIRLFIVSFFGVAFNQIMFFEGLNLTTPINSSIIMVGVPILVLVFSHFFIGDKLTRNRIIGIAIGFLGAAYLILQSGQLSLESNTFVGNIFVLMNASSYALFLVLVKPLMARYNPITIMKWVFLIGLIYVTPFSINLVVESDYASIPISIWLSVGYVVVFTTVFAYLLNNYSLKTISPTVNSAYIYLQPVIASVVAIWFGKDTLDYHEVLAALLIFVGVYFVSFAKKRVI